MANICETRYLIHGNQKELLRFFLSLKDVAVDHSDDYSELFKGDNYIQHRQEGSGYIVDVKWHKKAWFGEDAVELVLDTRWEPDFWDMGQVMKNYEGLSFEGFAEEPSNGIYINTDSTGEFFKDRYSVEVNAPGKCGFEHHYFAKGEENQICELVSDITEGKVNPGLVAEIKSTKIDALVKQMYGEKAYFIFNEFDYEY